MIDLAFAAGDGKGFSSESEAEETATTTLALVAPPVSQALVESVEANATPDFEPARAFDGPRPGMCFKKGKHGLGYYADVRAVQAPGAAGSEKLAQGDTTGSGTGKKEEAMYGQRGNSAAASGQPKSKIHSNEQTKYFIIKSSTHRNLVLSVENSVWATLHQNEEKFNKALYHSPYVVLIFSVQQSGHFQGYAKMLSPVGSARKNRIFAGFEGRHFDIRWLRLEDIPFSKVTNICNPWNENKSVKISRDGQELPNDVGRTLCELFDAQVYASDPGSYVSDENEEETGPGKFGSMGKLQPDACASPCAGPYSGYASYMASPPPLHSMCLPPPGHVPWGHPYYPPPLHQPPAGPTGYILTPHATLPNSKSCNGASLPDHPGSLLGQSGGQGSSSSSSPSPRRKKRHKAEQVDSAQGAAKDSIESSLPVESASGHRVHRSSRGRRRKSSVDEDAHPEKKKAKRHRRHEEDDDGRKGRAKDSVPPKEWRGPAIRLTPCSEVDVRWQ
mmetsp:Transcript_41198/g.74467  ORF Transcript_41198/g.74467 Transcript_41198/m.74467 type:complete len:502 (+) Transcript_41198:27-1532(+)